VTGNEPAAAVPGLYELADGVYDYVIPGVIQLNAGIIVGDDTVAVIDTGTTEDDARALLEAVKSVTDLPVRYVINTHHHGDHSFGNWWFLPAVVLGHARCRVHLLGDEGASHRDTMAAHLPMAREQIRAVPLAPPDVTFAGYLDLHLGRHSLRLAHLGRAHTDNDIAVGVEGADIAFAGDLIESSGPPVVSEGYPAEWGPTLRNLGAAMVDRYVPGHGLVVDSMFVADQASAFETVTRICAEAASAAEAMHALPQSVFDVLGYQTANAVKRYYETVK
jgi:glyoxylase-like metal-dependent hydrolase (beta-lactamase superfamily II)